MTEPLTTAQDPVARLKTLLFDTETQRLIEVQRRLDALAAGNDERHAQVLDRQSEAAKRIDTLFERAGTDDRLKKSVAGVLDGALREAEVTRHEPLSQAIAPLVVKTIKTELRNSEAELVDALYPHTGKMVKQYVRAAMTELLADIERKLSGAKPSAFEARAKALGVTVPELLLNETQALKVDELFLVKRGSGELVAHWERSTAEGGALTSSGGNRDVLIAGYLSGIMSFSEEAFDDRKGSLRSLDMDGERIFVRASPAYLLAARCSGRAPAAVERVVDDAFVDVLGRYREVLTAGGDPPAVSELLPALAQRCETDLAKARADLEAKARETAPPRGRGRLYALLTLLLLPLLAWFAWSTWQAWETRRVQGLADAVIAGTPELRGFPVRADVSSGGTVVALRGLTPDANVRTALAARLQRDVTGSEIRNELGTLPERIAPVLPPDTSQDVAALREALATARRQLGETADRLATVAAQAARLPEVQARADAAVATLERQLDELRRRPVGSAPAPLMLLVEYIRTNAVFFGNGTDLLDEARAASTLDGLVTRLRATDAMLRVVGYTDERGQNQANQALALARADRIAALLIARGVDRERISTVGRTAGLELSRATGPGSPNRRVEFELGFIGEPRTP